MIRTQIQLNAEQVKWLKRFALEKGISMSHAIRDGVDFYRMHIEKGKLRHVHKQKALNAVGSFSSTE